VHNLLLSFTPDQGRSLAFGQPLAERQLHPKRHLHPEPGAAEPGVHGDHC